VTRAVADVRGGYYPRERPHPLTVGDLDPLPLAGAGRLSLSIWHYYHVAEEPERPSHWAVRTAGYQYVLYGADGRAIVAYHWHPAGRSPVITPHLHLGAGAEVGRRDVADAHLPTGHITLEDVLRLAISEFGVRPLRRDWSEILDRTRRSLD
jgi:hypothetical protein